MATRRPLALLAAGSGEVPAGDTLTPDLFPVTAPPWAPSTTYRAGDLVWQTSLLYRRKAAGASGATFDPTAWDLVGPRDGDAWLGLALTLSDAGSAVSFQAVPRTYYMRIRRCPRDLPISRIGMSIGSSGGNLTVGAYSGTGTGTSAAPGALLASSPSTPCPAAGYAEVALSSTATVNAGDWLALAGTSGSATFAGLSLGTGVAPIGDNLERMTSAVMPTTPSFDLGSAGRAFVLLGIP